MSEQIAVLAPRGRDADVVRQVLARGGIEAVVCPDLGALVSGLQEGVDAALVTEEALQGEGLAALLAWTGAQPPWSDLPMIVLATHQAGRRSAAATRVLDELDNVVLLERPINAETLTSAARSVLRARRRQYQARDLLAEQARRERELERLNATLEQRVEERTRELDGARETLAFALDSAGMGSWDLDLRLDTARRSPQHDRIFGYATPVGDWSVERFLAHVVEEERDEIRREFDAATRAGSLDLVCRIRGADGGLRWINAKGRASRDGEGRVVRMAGVVIDITEPRRIEDALRQSQKMEAIGQLTGGVAHDFNNLLTVVIGGLDMILRRPEPAERVSRLAQSALAGARRGEQLTQQLLAFSRRQVLRPRTFDPNRTLLDFEVLARRAVGESVEIVFDLAPDAYAIRTDPAQFESAVLNLLVNARDAMPGGGRVVVRTRNLALAPTADLAGGEYLELQVVDAGQGMDRATLARVFEPFFTTKDVGRGSGLGLSQVYGFVRSARGEVEIESAPGAGATVRLLFPRSLEDCPTEPAPVPPRVRQARGETLLLVDDDDDVRAMALESLQELDYRVFCACNAHEALACLEGGDRIDLLFSDIVMPGGMDGVQLAAEARRLRPGIRVLLTSGYVGDSPRHVDLDDVSVLDKPYGREDLAEKLQELLTK